MSSEEIKVRRCRKQVHFIHVYMPLRTAVEVDDDDTRKEVPLKVETRNLGPYLDALEACFAPELWWILTENPVSGFTGDHGETWNLFAYLHRNVGYVKPEKHFFGYQVEVSVRGVQARLTLKDAKALLCAMYSQPVSEFYTLLYPANTNLHVEPGCRLSFPEYYDLYLDPDLRQTRKRKAPKRWGFDEQ